MPTPITRHDLRFGRSAWPFAALAAAFLALALLLALGAGLRWSGEAARHAGLSEATTPVTLRIGGEALAIPANLIRFADQRRGGVRERVDLQLPWPDLAGGSTADAEALAGGLPDRLLYVSLEPRDTGLDEAMRFHAVYNRLFAGAPQPGPAGLLVRPLAEGSGYDGEEVYYEPQAASRTAEDARPPFVARCLVDDGRGLPPTCQREVHIGTGLSATERFPRALLGEWRNLDTRLRAFLEGLRAG